MTPSGPRLTVLSKSLMGLSTSAATTVNKVVSGVVTTPSGRPVMRVPPLNVSASQTQSSGNGGQQQASQQQQSQSIRGIVTRQSSKEVGKKQSKEPPRSEFHLVIKHDYSGIICTFYSYELHREMNEMGSSIVYTRLDGRLMLKKKKPLPEQSCRAQQ